MKWMCKGEKQMINLVRRKRQASQNAGIIIEKFADDINKRIPLCNVKEEIKEVKSEAELDCIIKVVEQEVNDIVSAMESDWAIPVIMEAVGKIYYGSYKQYRVYGTTFKRALAYFWDNIFRFHGEQKNINQIIRLLFRCFALEELYSYKKIFWAIPDFYCFFCKGYIEVPEIFMDSIFELGKLNAGRGKRLRVAESNSKLMNATGIDYFKALFGVLQGENPQKISVFKGTFYEKIPGIENAECKKFWQELFFRYSFYIAALLESEEGTDVILFREFGVELPEGFITQESVKNSFWQREWFQKQSRERYGNLIVERPIMRISENGDFATSPVLIGDSINSFIEKQIFNYATRNSDIRLPSEIFRTAFSEPFEQNCIDYFRSLGFTAGHVSEGEIWKTQNGNINMKTVETSLYGEIDVLAYQPEREVLLLIECKVLNDVEDTRTYKNLIAKLKEDSEGYKDKLLKKEAWLKEAFSIYYKKDIEPVLILLTDIPLPVIEFDDNKIIYTDFVKLKRTMDIILNDNADENNGEKNL